MTHKSLMVTTGDQRERESIETSKYKKTGWWRQCLIKKNCFTISGILAGVLALSLNTASANIDNTSIIALSNRIFYIL